MTPVPEARTHGINHKAVEPSARGRKMNSRHAKCNSSEESTCALGRLGDRVPLAPGLEEGSAALASRREAGVSTAAAAVALAWASVAIHVHAASVASCDAHIATATVPACACETIAVAIAAMNRWQPAPRLRGRIRCHLRGLLRQRLGQLLRCCGNLRLLL